MRTTQQALQASKEKLQALQDIIPVKDHQNRIAQINELANDPNFWGEPKQAAGLMKERQDLTSLLEAVIDFQKELEFCSEYNELDPGDAEIHKRANKLEEELGKFEIKQLLNGETDNAPAILTITGGAGGLEAAHWANMLLRMYSRWADQNGYKIELLDLKPSDEHSAICIDGATIRIEGPYAYGYLKREIGVMRLVRNSPFSSVDARHTSFAAVNVSPDIEDTIEIEVREQDLEIQATRSGGSGGQAINKISSCIILKHIPSGIMIRSQTERSQIENRRIALKLLKSKLYDLEVKKKNAERDKQLEQQQQNKFGSQIRSYVLSPYTLIKDHRSEHETNNVDAVLDGALQPFLEAQLRIKF